MNHRFARLARRATWLAACLIAAGTASAADIKSLTVCADPGNMPLSNEQGEGFENKIAEVLGKALGASVHYYWRPSIERGLMRTTLSEGNCDVWMDMASDTEGAVVLKPLYKSTFVLVYRNDKGIDIKSLDDPQLKHLRVGVFQVSAIRLALSEHNVVDNTVVHYLSHNADIDKSNQPSYQVQQVIDGSLDVAAIWGPMAGYYKTVLHQPVVVQPVNMMEQHVPLEFDMTLAVPRGRPDIKNAVQQALEAHAAQIHKILDEYGVPLVRCSECIISGDLPAHGPYTPLKEPVVSKAERAKIQAERMAALKKALAAGANPDDELGDAIVANDLARVRYLLKHGAHTDATDGDGYTPAVNATRFRFLDIAAYLVEHGADANLADRSGWTPLMYAAWDDDVPMLKMLLKHGARMDVVNGDGLDALAIAAQNAKIAAAEALAASGADVNAPRAKGGYTPLMLAAMSGSSELAELLIAHGAKIDATNPGGVTALMITAATDHARVAEVLLKRGANVDAKSDDGRTALSIARANNADAVLRLLAPAGQSGGPNG